MASGSEATRTVGIAAATAAPGRGSRDVRGTRSGGKDAQSLDNLLTAARRATGSRALRGRFHKQLERVLALRTTILVDRHYGNLMPRANRQYRFRPRRSQPSFRSLSRRQPLRPRRLEDPMLCRIRRCGHEPAGEAFFVIRHSSLDIGAQRLVIRHCRARPVEDREPRG